MSVEHAVVDLKATRAAGQLDPTFNVSDSLKSGSSGVFPDLNSGGDKFYIVDYQLGLFDPRPTSIARYNADGTLDNGFNDGQKLQIPSLIPDVSGMFAHLHIQRIVFTEGETITCVGVAGALDGDGYYYAPAAVRITAEGEMDKSFGNKKNPAENDGTAIYFTEKRLSLPDNALFNYYGPLCWSSKPGKDILFVSKIIANENTITGIFHLVKMKPDGQLDEAFGKQGLLLIEPSTGTRWRDYYVDDQGKLTMVGQDTQSKQGVALRYTDEGELDSSFGQGGRLLVATSVAGLEIQKVSVAADGRTTLLVTYAGSDGTKVALMRRLVNGAADPDFHGGGLFVVDSVTADMRVDQAGRYLLAGSDKARLTRLTASGELDSEFGTNGSMEYPDFSSLKIEAVQQSVDLLASIHKSIPPFNNLLVRISGAGSSAHPGRPSAVGDPDPAFGDAGALVARNKSVFTEIKIDRDQKFYLVGFEQVTGNLTNQSWISRHEADGSPDISFNGGAIVYIPSLLNGAREFANIHIRGLVFDDQAGTITGVGESQAHTSSGYYEAPAAFRIKSTGELDTTFGNSGTAIYPTGESPNYKPLYNYIPFRSDRKNSQSGGDIMFLSRINDYPNRSFTFYLVKIKGDGSLDAGFGDKGHLLIDPETVGSRWNDYAVDPQGKLTLVGYSALNDRDQGLRVVVRYNTDGTLDPTFGAGGKQFIDAHLLQVHVSGDGKITLLANVIEDDVNKVALMRREENGAPDVTFQGGKPVVIDSPAEVSAPRMFVDETGRVVFARAPHGTTPALISRWTPTGELDITFGANGSIEPEGLTMFKGAALQRDQDLLAQIREADGRVDLLVRYLG